MSVNGVYGSVILTRYSEDLSLETILDPFVPVPRATTSIPALIVHLQHWTFLSVIVRLWVKLVFRLSRPRSERMFDIHLRGTGTCICNATGGKVLPELGLKGTQCAHYGHAQ